MVPPQQQASVPFRVLFIALFPRVKEGLEREHGGGGPRRRRRTAEEEDRGGEGGPRRRRRTAEEKEDRGGEGGPRRRRRTAEEEEDRGGGGGPRRLGRPRVGGLTQHRHASPLAGEVDQGEQLVLSGLAQLAQGHGVSGSREEHPSQLPRRAHQGPLVRGGGLVPQGPCIGIGIVKKMSPAREKVFAPLPDFLYYCISFHTDWFQTFRQNVRLDKYYY